MCTLRFRGKNYDTYQEFLPFVGLDPPNGKYTSSFLSTVSHGLSHRKILLAEKTNYYALILDVRKILIQLRDGPYCVSTVEIDTITFRERIYLLDRAFNKCSLNVRVPD